MAVRFEHTLPRDLSTALWGVFPPAMLVVLIVAAFADPQFYMLMLAKDIDGGIVENATVVVLLPGIVAGFAAFFFHRRQLPKAWLGWWILIWTLACVYFAGEEISWGQWIFNWKTPDFIEQLNTQHETNLHNMTPWLFQKPQALVELWIFIAGLIMPLRRRFKKNQAPSDPLEWRFWALPTFVCVPSAGLTVLVRLFRSVPTITAMPRLNEMGTSELREYYIALFLCLYMMSFWYRARQVKRSAVPRQDSA